MDGDTIVGVSDEQGQEITNVGFRLNILSIVLSVVVVIVYVWIVVKAPKHSKRVTFRLTTLTSVADLFYSIFQIVGLVAGPESFFCSFSTWAAVFSVLSSVFLTTCIAINLFLVVVLNRKDIPNIQSRFVIGSILSAAALSVIPAGGRMYGWDEPESTCWFIGSGTTKNIIYQWVALFGPIQLCILFSLMVVLITFIKLRRSNTRSRTLTQANDLFKVYRDGRGAMYPVIDAPSKLAGKLNAPDTHPPSSSTSVSDTENTIPCSASGASAISAASSHTANTFVNLVKPKKRPASMTISTSSPPNKTSTDATLDLPFSPIPFTPSGVMNVTEAAVSQTQAERALIFNVLSRFILRMVPLITQTVNYLVETRVYQTHTVSYPMLLTTYILTSLQGTVNAVVLLCGGELSVELAKSDLRAWIRRKVHLICREIDGQPKPTFREAIKRRLLRAADFLARNFLPLGEEEQVFFANAEVDARYDAGARVTMSELANSQAVEITHPGVALQARKASLPNTQARDMSAFKASSVEGAVKDQSPSTSMSRAFVRDLMGDGSMEWWKFGSLGKHPNDGVDNIAEEPEAEMAEVVADSDAEENADQDTIADTVSDTASTAEMTRNSSSIRLEDTCPPIRPSLDSRRSAPRGRTLSRSSLRIGRDRSHSRSTISSKQSPLLGALCENSEIFKYI